MKRTLAAATVSVLAVAGCGSLGDREEAASKAAVRVFSDRWRVVAAGCSAQGARPYDCTLQGG